MNIESIFKKTQTYEKCLYSFSKVDSLYYYEKGILFIRNLRLNTIPINAICNNVRHRNSLSYYKIEKYKGKVNRIQRDQTWNGLEWRDRRPMISKHNTTNKAKNFA